MQNSKDIKEDLHDCIMTIKTATISLNNLNDYTNNKEAEKVYQEVQNELKDIQSRIQTYRSLLNHES